MIIDLSNQIGWDIAGAIRGPDDGPCSYNLKCMTTAVFRYFICRPPDECLVFMSPMEATQFWQELTELEKEKVRKRWDNDRHFASHIADAAMALERTGDARFSEWLEQMEKMTGMKVMLLRANF